MKSRGARRQGQARLSVEVVGRDVAAARGLAAWLIRTAPRAARGLVTVALVSDRRIGDLNRRFRGVDAVTDVLSFASETHDVGRSTIRMAPGAALGDLVIAVGRATRQAREHGHALSTEIRVLALHGLLHLLGYDHERDRGQMAAIEERLRRRGRVPTGLIARTRRSAR